MDRRRGVVDQDGPRGDRAVDGRTSLIRSSVPLLVAGDAAEAEPGMARLARDEGTAVRLGEIAATLKVPGHRGGSSFEPGPRGGADLSSCFRQPYGVTPCGL
jgi:hypothetical protein